jgi:predicted nucleotidyltransferase
MTPGECITVMMDRIVRDCHPLKIILFGSHARGEAGPESDLDLLVVLPEVASRRQSAVKIRCLLTDLPVPKDIVVTTPEEIARRGDLVGTVLRPALREGKVLYERSRAHCRSAALATLCPGRSESSGIIGWAANHRISACLLAGAADGREGTEGCAGLLRGYPEIHDTNFRESTVTLL